MIRYSTHQYSGVEGPDSVVCGPSLDRSPPHFGLYDLPVEVGHLHAIVVHHRKDSYSASSQE